MIVERGGNLRQRATAAAVFALNQHVQASLGLAENPIERHVEFGVSLVRLVISEVLMKEFVHLRPVITGFLAFHDPVVGVMEH